MLVVTNSLQEVGKAAQAKTHQGFTLKSDNVPTCPERATSCLGFPRVILVLKLCGSHLGCRCAQPQANRWHPFRMPQVVFIP